MTLASVLNPRNQDLSLRWFETQFSTRWFFWMNQMSNDRLKWEIVYCFEFNKQPSISAKFTTEYCLYWCCASVWAMASWWKPMTHQFVLCCSAQRLDPAISILILLKNSDFRGFSLKTRTISQIEILNLMHTVNDIAISAQNSHQFVFWQEKSAQLKQSTAISCYYIENTFKRIQNGSESKDRHWESRKSWVGSSTEGFLETMGIGLRRTGKWCHCRHSS